MCFKDPLHVNIIIMLYFDKGLSSHYHLEMYSLVPSRLTGYLIKYNLFTTISDFSDLYTNDCGLKFG